MHVSELFTRNRSYVDDQRNDSLRWSKLPTSSTQLTQLLQLHRHPIAYSPRQAGQGKGVAVLLRSRTAAADDLGSGQQVVLLRIPGAHQSNCWRIVWAGVTAVYLFRQII